MIPPKGLRCYARSNYILADNAQMFSDKTPRLPPKGAYLDMKANICLIPISKNIVAIE